MSHTEGELEAIIQSEDSGCCHSIIDKNGTTICIMSANDTTDELDANHIALCWNSHDGLLDACKDLLLYHGCTNQCIEKTASIRKAEAAIAKCE